MPNQGKNATLRKMIDYHIHTIFCGHATGELEDYVEKARELGFKEIGFSDHFPLLNGWKPQITMVEEELPVYVEKILELNNHYSDIDIKLGIEVDYLPEYVEKTREILEKHPFDYVYGSIHYIRGWGFDNPDYRELWEEQNVTDVYLEYYSLLKEAISTGLFDIISHFDLVKKFGHRPQKDISKETKRVISLMKEQNMVLEVNTSGLRMPVEEVYPSEEILSYSRKKSIPIVIGSDAHNPEDVGRDFDKAKRILKRVGYKNTVTFRQRKIENKVKL